MRTLRTAYSRSWELRAPSLLEASSTFIFSLIFIRLIRRPPASVKRSSLTRWSRSQSAVHIALWKPLILENYWRVRHHLDSEASPFNSKDYVIYVSRDTYYAFVTLRKRQAGTRSIYLAAQLGKYNALLFATWLVSGTS